MNWKITCQVPGTLPSPLPCLICLLLILTPRIVLSQVATDGSVGPAQTLCGPDHQIPDTLGTTVGTNLFHSFQTFSIIQDDSSGSIIRCRYRGSSRR